jgi:hypothetical protein
VPVWNRVEGRPRAESFDRALAAEVRDALWMVTRQWQMGELHGDDAGSPILARIHASNTRLTRYQAGRGPASDFDTETPLETQVERRPLSFTQGGRELSLDLRLLMGRHWLKLLRPLGDFTAAFLAAYPIRLPDPNDPADAIYSAHPQVLATLRSVAGRRIDGGKLHAHLRGGGHAYDGIAGLAGRETEVDRLADRFLAWFDALISQPSAPRDAWVADRLEYQFACSAPDTDGEKVLVADEYFHGHLDWYNLDYHDRKTSLGPPDGGGEPPPPVPITQTLLPTPVAFNGMPSTRWWAFEDGKTNLGDVRPDTTDLPKLLLLEFGLIYANDWFLIPCTLPFGSLSQLRGMAVTNVFGERTWVEAAGRGADDDWQRWAMFSCNQRGKAEVAADTRLLVLPVAAKVQEGAPLEEVFLVRDEVANMVWAVEKTIALPNGEGTPGSEAARELRAWYERDLQRRLGAPPAPPAGAPGAKIRYQVMNQAPEEWIPFVPVHVPGDVREIQLQRAAQPRILEGDPDPIPAKVRPRTSLVRHGLDAGQAYFLHEEEVPRSGVRVTQAFQRTRWRDGRAWVWLGARKQAGRGEATSGLGFDLARDLPPSR